MIRLLLIALIAGPLHAQDLVSHRWKERVIVVYCDDLQQTEALEQLELFKSTREQLEDRAMVIYQVSDQGYRFQFSEEIKALNSDPNEENFKVILIGLDGGIKYQSSTVEPAEVYYSLIDRMPMRRSEMRKRIKNGG